MVITLCNLADAYKRSVGTLPPRSPNVQYPPTPLGGFITQKADKKLDLGTPPNLRERSGLEKAKYHTCRSHLTTWYMLHIAKTFFFFHSRIIPGRRTDAFHEVDCILQKRAQKKGGGKCSYLCTYWHKYRRIYIRV